MQVPRSHREADAGADVAHVATPRPGHRLLLVQRPTAPPGHHTSVPQRETWLAPALARERVAANRAARLRRRMLGPAARSPEARKCREWLRAERVRGLCITYAPSNSQRKTRRLARVRLTRD